jgi:hypothetical protein
MCPRVSFGATQGDQRSASAAFEVDVDNADTPDIGQESAAVINGAIQAIGLTNVQQQPHGGVQTVQGKNFTQALQVNYTANTQIHQATMQVYGIFVTLLNPSTQVGAFINVWTLSQGDLQAALPDASSMIGSML